MGVGESFAIIARRGGVQYGAVVEDHGKRYTGATTATCVDDFGVASGSVV